MPSAAITHAAVTHIHPIGLLDLTVVVGAMVTSSSLGGTYVVSVGSSFGGASSGGLIGVTSGCSSSPGTSIIGGAASGSVVMGGVKDIACC